MSQYNLDSFVQESVQKDYGQGLFEMESERMQRLSPEIGWTITKN